MSFTAAAATARGRRPGLGSPAIVAGIFDGLHVWIDRLAGDDVTALVSLVAGVALVLLGVVVLWR